MKYVMRVVIPPSLCILLLLLLSTCKKEDTKIELPDFTVVDISEESSWDYWIVGKEEYLFIDEDIFLPKTVFFHSFKNGKDYGISFNSQGLPSRVFADGYIFLFDNYNGKKVDIGLITPLGEILVARGIENNSDWPTPPKSIQSKADVIRWTGRVIGAIPCIVSGATAFVSEGAAVPFALWTCGNYLAEMADKFLDDAEIKNGYTEVYTAYDFAKTNYECRTDIADCLVNLASKAIEEYADYIEEVEENEALVIAAERTLSTTSVEFYEGFETYESGTFPSSWVADGNATNILNNYIDYLFSHSGERSLKLTGSVGGCWAGIAYHNLTITPPFEIELAVKNAYEVLSGCHPYRVLVGLREGTHWINPSRTFVQFEGDGKIYGGGGKELTTYITIAWYLLRIRYEIVSTSEIKLTYWIDNKYFGSESLNASNNENLLNNFEISIGEGSAWFDEIRIYK